MKLSCEVRFALGHPGALTISTVSLVHLIQAWLLLLFPNSGGGIALSSLMWVADNFYPGGDRILVAVTMMVCADLALVSVFRRGGSRLLALTMFVPQQVILLIMAGFVAWCTLHQTYADGVMRPWEFILNDQIGWLGLALAHSAAIVRSSSRG